ncbi:MAG: restriction endonuclease [Candidatus Thiodiazotropha sp.]
MKGKTMWMVRSASGGRLADAFVEANLIAIGWADIGDLNQYKNKSEILSAVKKQWPDWSDGRRMSSASQLERFRSMLEKDDRIITYDSGNRIYHVGTITGDYQYNPDLLAPFVNTRSVEWSGSVERDALSVSARNTLGSVLTLFQVSKKAADEILDVLEGGTKKKETPIEEDEETLLERYKSEAFEIIKDRVTRLDWDQMQELVASLLRAMGYKTRVSKPGPDRGVDIMASPDGFGFESPRIIVEVKHRTQQTGSQQLRSFIGGRHKDDKGLYVSTSGFTKDARYEADRANIPVMLMDIDDLVQALMRHYDVLDMDGRTLLPLKKIYWPV